LGVIKYFFLNKSRTNLLSDDDCILDPVINILTQNVSMLGDKGKFGDIYLGRCLRTRSRVFLRSIDLFRHIGIFGTTGSGKTTTTAVIIKQLINRFNILVLDWHGEYADLLSTDNVLTVGGVNPFKLSIDPSTLDLEFVEIFEEVFDLTPTQSYIVMRALKESKVSSIPQLLDVIESMEHSARWFYDSKLSLVRKLSLLDDPLFKSLFKKEFIDLRDYLKMRKLAIIDLSTLGSISLRRLTSLLTIKYIEKNVSSCSLTPLVIVVDEAHNIFTNESNTNLIARLFGEIRKKGVGIIAVTQSPSLVSQHMIRNTNTKIIHSIKSWKDSEIIGDSIGLDSEWRRRLAYLDVGEALISAPNYSSVKYVKIDMNVLRA